MLLAISIATCLAFASGASPVAAAGGGRYTALTPARILDSRTGTGVPAGPFPGGVVINVPVAGRGGVPTSGAIAVVLNVTVTDVAAPGFLTVWPTGAPLPVASNLNYAAGQTVANLVEVSLGTGGQVNIYSERTASVVADVAGWVNGVSTGADGRLNPLVPARLLDTRTGVGGANTIGPSGSISLSVVGRAGVPAAGVSAVVLNLTVTNPSASGFVTAWPHGVSRPLASNLNFLPGQTVANRAVIAVGQGGLVDFFNLAGAVDLVVDISGWFTGAAGPGGAVYYGLTPSRILDTRSLGRPLQQGGVRPVLVAGQGGVPPMGTANSPTAVVANITVTNTTASGYLTAWPEGGALPLASDINWPAGATVPNLVVVALGPSGVVDLYNAVGSTDVIVDVVGYYVGAQLPPPPTGSAMADLINQDRVAAGLPPLQWSGCLASVAQGESARQASQGYISHAGGVDLDLACGFTRAGENVGYTSAGINDAQLNTLFMNSPGHRANILNPNFRVVGTAWVVAANGDGYISEEFAG